MKCFPALASRVRSRPERYDPFMDAAVVEKELREVLNERAAAEGIAAAWLFGSVARGTNFELVRKK